MRPLRLVLAVIVALVVPGSAPADYIFESMVEGKRLVIKDSGSLRRRIQIETGGVASALDDAEIHVYNAAGGGDAVCFRAPAERWIFRAGVRTYNDRLLADGPLLKGKIVPNRFSTKLKAVSKNPSQPLDYTLDEPTQQRIGVIYEESENPKTCDAMQPFEICDTDADCSPGTPGQCQPAIFRTCAEFVLPVVDKPGTFVARNSPAPASCPVPPPCP